MRRREPTRVEQQTLDFVRNFIMANGYAPTVKEIADALHVTGTAIITRLDRLERKGKLTRVRGSSRTIVVRPVESAA